MWAALAKKGYDLIGDVDRVFSLRIDFDDGNLRVERFALGKYFYDLLLHR